MATPTGDSDEAGAESAWWTIIRRRFQPKPSSPQSSWLRPNIRARFRGSRGIRGGSGARRSTKNRISLQALRGGSSSQTTMGAFAWPVHSRRAAFSPPPCWATAVYGIRFTRNKPFAASPQGPGTPWVRTSRRSRLDLADSTSRYFTERLLRRAITAPPRDSRPGRQRAPASPLPRVSDWWILAVPLRQETPCRTCETKWPS
jgi:hypothetical protein